MPDSITLELKVIREPPLTANSKSPLSKEVMVGDPEIFNPCELIFLIW
jgi:hypothetical protein